MPIPRVVARMNRVGLNRVTRRVAPRPPGLGVVVHRGRRSGREYRTPVNVFRSSDGLRLALTYGADSDWVKNVLAAGGCRVYTGGRCLDLTAPRLVHDPERAGIRPAERTVLGLLRVHDFLDLRESAPARDGREEADMGKTLIDVDEDCLTAAQQALHTATKKDTVNAALREVTALAARRRDLQRLTSGGLPDLADAEVMRAAWQR